MVSKIINATDAKVGLSIIVDGVPCRVTKMDVSKTGKHGHAKVRISAKGLIGEQKKVFVVPGHERLQLPMIDKRKGQVLSVGDSQINIMDIESFETLNVDCPEEIKKELEPNSNVEYWDLEGSKIIKRKI